MPKINAYNELLSKSHVPGRARILISLVGSIWVTIAAIAAIAVLLAHAYVSQQPIRVGHETEIVLHRWVMHLVPACTYIDRQRYLIKPIQQDVYIYIHIYNQWLTASTGPGAGPCVTLCSQVAGMNRLSPVHQSIYISAWYIRHIIYIRMHHASPTYKWHVQRAHSMPVYRARRLYLYICYICPSHPCTGRRGHRGLSIWTTPLKLVGSGLLGFILFTLFQSHFLRGRNAS